MICKEFGGEITGPIETSKGQYTLEARFLFTVLKKGTKNRQLNEP